MQNKLTMFTAAFLFTVVLLSLPHISFAASQDTNGGVKNEYTYQEVSFITGKPIIFKGSSKDVKISEKLSGTKLTQTYDLKLLGSNGKDTITRKVVYESDIANHAEIGQQTAKGSVKTGYKETIVIDGVTYTLKDYQFSNGTVTDNRAASNYYSGNIISRKIYSVPGTRTKPAQEITVNTNSRHVGYENFWGATETQINEVEIINGKGEIGTVTNRLSTSKSRVLNYEENAASLSSFNGGYSVVSSLDMVSKYTYDIPFGAGKGELSINAENMPTIERLIVPKFRDIANNNAKEAVEKLYSLGILEDQSNFFSPTTPMTRYDFSVALAKAVDLRVLAAKKTKAKDTSSVFKDVKRTMKDYPYLESAVNKGLVKGMNADYFAPNDSLTRGQIATIIVRALGLENKAPDPGYQTKFADNGSIPYYAKDGVYIVNELGIMVGDSFNRFNPKKPITRAEASVVLKRVLEYLENDLKQNYRDDILLFN